MGLDEEHVRKGIFYETPVTLTWLFNFYVVYFAVLHAHNITMNIKCIYLFKYI